MFIRLFHNLKEGFPNIGFLITRKWYWYVNKADKEHQITFMNYGYADYQDLQLNESDAWNRFPIQLYHYAGTKDTDLYNSFDKGVFNYYFFVMQKPAYA